MIRLLVSRPLVSALASAFLRRPMRISADLTGQRALETPKALPTEVSPYSCDCHFDASAVQTRFLFRCNRSPSPCALSL
jgi:hypothetical protein